MRDLTQLSARDIVTRIAQGQCTAEAVARAFAERIAQHEPRIHAWQHFDAVQALAQAQALDAHGSQGALHGLPIGVKDLMDTWDMPTTYGSPIYAGYQPQVDAACVAMARSAGAVVMGKTVTTEFATFQPGSTVNPASPEGTPHTPGGSSSGSAAAVAAGMVPVAFGTQTAGSILRPAAYCGVVGYKPTHAMLPLAGVKPLAPSLDTVGALGRCVDDVALLIGTLARMALAARPDHTFRVGLCHTPCWERASADTLAAIEGAAKHWQAAGAQLQQLVLPTACEQVIPLQMDTMAYEAAAAFTPEVRTHAAQLSSGFAAVLATGRAITGTHFLQVQQQLHAVRAQVDALFADVDVLLVPSTEGAAPAGLQATGDPVFNRMWSALGNPCVHVPTGTAANGLPIGVTLVALRGADDVVVAAAYALERALHA